MAIYKLTITGNDETQHAFVYMKVLRNHPGDQSYWHRHRSKGSWTLSSADNGWAVSDTTGKALKVIPSLVSFSFASMYMSKSTFFPQTRRRVVHHYIKKK
jgi:hypothetical protein